MKRYYIYVCCMALLLGACEEDPFVETTKYKVPDPATTTFVKFINTAPRSPSLAFYVDGVKVTGGSSTNGKEAGLNYASIFPGEYSALPPTSGTLEAKIISSDAANPGLSLYEGAVQFEAGKNYTVFAVDEYSAATKKISTLILEDQLPQRDTAVAMVRFINLSPDAGPVTITQENGPVMADKLAYKSVTSFMAVPAPATTKLIFTDSEGKSIGSITGAGK